MELNETVEVTSHPFLSIYLTHVKDSKTLKRVSLPRPQWPYVGLRCCTMSSAISQSGSLPTIVDRMFTPYDIPKGTQSDKAGSCLQSMTANRNATKSGMK